MLLVTASKQTGLAMIAVMVYAQTDGTLPAKSGRPDTPGFSNSRPGNNSTVLKHAQLSHTQN